MKSLNNQNTLTIYLIETKLFSTSSQAFSLNNEKKFGEKIQGKIIYSPCEALYFLERKKAKIIKNNKELSKDSFYKIFLKNDKNFNNKFIVYKKLRERGYIVKEGLKFGGEFRVYEQNKIQHAKYICYAFSGSKLEIKELISKVRVSHSAGKKLLLAIVDSEEDVLFYEIDWIKI